MFWANPISMPRSKRAPVSATNCAGSISRGTEPRRYLSSNREAAAAGRELHTATGRLEHVIARHLHDVGAPVELLGLVLEEIGCRERIAIGLDITTTAGDRRVAPAEFPAGML